MGSEVKEVKEVKEDSQIVLKLKKFILDNYIPCYSAREADFSCTTTEVYNKLLDIFPHHDFTITQVVEWLDEGGYIFCDFGNMRIEWIFKHKNNY